MTDKLTSEDSAALPSPQPKSAEEELLEEFGKLIDKAAERMTEREFRNASKRAIDVMDRAIVRGKAKGETS